MLSAIASLHEVRQSLFSTEPIFCLLYAHAFGRDFVHVVQPVRVHIRVAVQNIERRTSAKKRLAYVSGHKCTTPIHEREHKKVAVKNTHCQQSAQNRNLRKTRPRDAHKEYRTYMMHEHILAPVPLPQLRGIFANEFRLVTEGIPIAFVFDR